MAITIDFIAKTYRASFFPGPGGRRGDLPGVVTQLVLEADPEVSTQSAVLRFVEEDRALPANDIMEVDGSDRLYLYLPVDTFDLVYELVTTAGMGISLYGNSTDVENAMYQTLPQAV